MIKTKTTTDFLRLRPVLS